jgi:transposase-like protein
MIQHFPKWLELVPLPDHNNEEATYAFLDNLLSRFKAPTKVFIDQGTEFRGEFQELCEKTLIDNRTTSRNHPEADGLVKQMVQMVK